MTFGPEGYRHLLRRVSQSSFQLSGNTTASLPLTTVLINSSSGSPSRTNFFSPPRQGTLSLSVVGPQWLFLLLVLLAGFGPWHDPGNVDYYTFQLRRSIFTNPNKISSLFNFESLPLINRGGVDRPFIVSTCSLEIAIFYRVKTGTTIRNKTVDETDYNYIGKVVWMLIIKVLYSKG